MKHTLPFPVPTNAPCADSSIAELLRQAMAGLLPTSGLNALLDRMEHAS